MDCLVPIQEHAVLHMQLDRSGQRHRFRIAPDGHQLPRRIGVIDRLHTLLDDRPFVQIGCYVVSRGTNEFDSTIVGLMIGPRTFESSPHSAINDGIVAVTCETWNALRCARRP